jgi:aspartyl protease family protein
MKQVNFRFVLQGALLLAGLAILAAILEFSGFFERYQPQPDEIQAAQAQLGTSAASSGATVAIERAEDGHFWVEAYVNGDRLRMMVDTGSTLVILSEADAATLGFDFWDEDFDQTAKTAGGAFPMARVVLDAIEVGDGISVRGVAAGVMKGDNDYSVLGLSFLNRLSGYQVRGDVLILQP